MGKHVVERGERKRREPFVHYEERHNWGCNGADNQPDVRGLRLSYPTPWRCLGPLLFHSLGLCSCLWPMLSPKAMHLVVVWAVPEAVLMSKGYAELVSLTPRMGHAGELALVAWVKESWWTDQLSCPPGRDPRL